MIIIQEMAEKFNTEEIRCGMLMFARHRSWPKGERGFIIYVDEQLIIVQYYPGISNVTNYMKIPISEAAEGEWEIRWSNDLRETFQFPEQGEAI